MSRHPATMKWVGSLSIAVALALTAACSKSKTQTSQEGGSAAPVEVASTPEPAQPATAPPVVDAPAPTNEPTPAETVVTPDPVPVTQTQDPKPTPSEAGPDPLKLLQESEARRVEYETSLAELAGKVETAKSNLATAQKDLLAFRNPYLARPALSPEEAVKTQGLNGAERVQWAETRVADAIAGLEAAQKAYDDAKANPPN